MNTEELTDRIRGAVFSGIMHYYGMDEADDYDQEEASGITSAVMEYLQPEVERLQERLFHIDYCLDKWRHGAPAALAEYADQRMTELDGR